MELSHKAELEVLGSIKKLLRGQAVTVDVVVCPSFPSLAAAAEMVKNAPKLMIGAQNVHTDEKGAFTGAVSVLQINPFAQWCIVGHSEQRRLTGETDTDVQRKVQTLLLHGVTPIVCIGETAEERAADKTVEVVTRQFRSILAKTSRTSLTKTVIAYEPIWAIGSGEVPDSNDVAGTMMLLRKLVAERFDATAADKLRILYGGSVTPDTVGAFVGEPGIDGVLVGGASTHPLQFVEIIKKVESAQ